MFFDPSIRRNAGRIVRESALKMIGCAFRLFGLLTVTVAFLATGFFLLLTADLYTYRPSAETRESVYPAARELMSATAMNMVDPFSGGERKRTLSFSEVELSAFIDLFTPKARFSPIGEPTLDLKKDEADLTLRLSFGNALIFLLNRIKGMPANENVGRLAAERAEGSMNLHVKLGANVTWKDGRPTVWVERLQFGKIPVGVVWLNDYIQPKLDPFLSERLDEMLENSPWRIAGTEFRDGEVLFHMVYIGLPVQLTEEEDQDAMLRFDNLTRFLGMRECPHCNQEDYDRMKSLMKTIGNDPQTFEIMRNRQKFQREYKEMFE